MHHSSWHSFSSYAHLSLRDLEVERRGMFSARRGPVRATRLPRTKQEDEMLAWVCLRPFLAWPDFVGVMV
jgi:hypothetical protein